MDAESEFRRKVEDLVSRGEEAVTRAAMREVAASMTAAVSEAQSRGENSHQVILDMIDWMNDAIAPLSEAAQTKFLDLYTQETNALADHSLEKADEISTKVQGFGNAVQLSIGLIVIMFIFWVLTR